MTKLWFLQRMDWIGALVTIITILVIVIKRITSSIDASLAGTALTNITNIPNSINVLGMALLEMESFMQSTERVLSLSKVKEEEPKSMKENYKEPPPDWPKDGRIVFEDFKYRYRKNLPLVIKHINVNIESNEKVGIVGRTGSGKSTMMAGLFRINEPAGGRILIDGIDITTVPLNILRTRMCILPQEATMFSGTVRSNLDPFGKYSEDDLKHVLELVNCNLELNDEVLEDGENFSMGQKQMICLARSLLKGSKILVMDEATANIDIKTDQTIQEMVKENFKNCTVITIAHRLHTIIDSDRVLVFEGGKLIENDSPQRLMSVNSTFNNYLKKSGCEDELKRLANKKKSKKKSKKDKKSKKGRKDNDVKEKEKINDGEKIESSSSSSGDLMKQSKEGDIVLNDN